MLGLNLKLVIHVKYIGIECTHSYVFADHGLRLNSALFLRVIRVLQNFA